MTAFGATPCACPAGAKTAEQTAAGKKANLTVYTEPAGQRLATLMCAVNDRFDVGLKQRVVKRPGPGDDAGSSVLRRILKLAG